jgi:hypothetical protein
MKINQGMKLLVGCFPLVTLALVALLPVTGCKSNQSNTQNPANASAPGSTATPNSAAPSGATAPNGAAAPNAAAQNPPAAPPPPPPPAVVELPIGTHLHVRLDEDLGSKISQPGETFHATIAQDVVVDGQTIIAKGARAEGTVVDAKPLGKFKGEARLEVRLDRVHTQWGAYPVNTSSIEQVEKGKGKRTALFAGGGGAFGAIVGGLAGGGKGAAIGALAGGGAGTAGGAMTGNKQIVLPAETLLTFRLQRPVHITQGQ